MTGGFPPSGRSPHLAKFYKTCYNILGAWICAGAASDGRRVVPSFPGGGRTSLYLLHYIGGGDVMVTYSDLFQLGILIVSIISLVLQIKKK